MFTRPTTMAEAFLNATVKQIQTGKVDHVKGTGNWIARHVAVTAQTREGFGLVREYDKRPQAPNKGGIKTLPEHIQAAMSQGFYEVMKAQG
jgi:hypothetical protein